MRKVCQVNGCDRLGHEYEVEVGPTPGFPDGYASIMTLCPNHAVSAIIDGLSISRTDPMTEEDKEAFRRYMKDVDETCDRLLKEEGR